MNPRFFRPASLTLTGIVLLTSMSLAQNDRCEKNYQRSVEAIQTERVECRKDVDQIYAMRNSSAEVCAAEVDDEIAAADQQQMGLQDLYDKEMAKIDRESVMLERGLGKDIAAVEADASLGIDAQEKKIRQLEIANDRALDAVNLKYGALEERLDSEEKKLARLRSRINQKRKLCGQIGKPSYPKVTKVVCDEARTESLAKAQERRAKCNG